MSNVTDLGAIAVGACLGYGLKKEIKSVGNVCRNALLGAVTAAAVTAAGKKEVTEADDKGGKNGH